MENFTLWSTFSLPQTAGARPIQPPTGRDGDPCGGGRLATFSTVPPEKSANRFLPERNNNRTGGDPPEYYIAESRRHKLLQRNSNLKLRSHTHFFTMTAAAATTTTSRVMDPTVGRDRLTRFIRTRIQRRIIIAGYTEGGFFLWLVGALFCVL